MLYCISRDRKTRDVVLVLRKNEDDYLERFRIGYTHLQGADKPCHFVKTDFEAKTLFISFHVGIHPHQQLKVFYSAQVATHFQSHYFVDIMIITEFFKDSISIAIIIEHIALI